MKCNVKYIVFAFMAMSFAITTTAQNWTAEMLSQSMAAHRNNAAYRLKSGDKWWVALPSTNVQAWSSSVAPNSVINTQNGVNTLPVASLINSLADQNNLFYRQNIGTLAVVYQPNNWQFSLAHSIQIGSFFGFNKVLPQLILQGNAQFIGEEVTVKTGFEAVAYQDFAVGVNRQIGNLSVGARLHYLSGMVHGRMADATLKVYTDPDVYQLRLSTDIEIQNSGWLDYQSIDSVTTDFSGFFNKFGQQGGVALDLGAQYTINNLQLGASVNGLGRLNWNNNAQKLSSNKTIEFEGLDIKSSLSGGDVSFDQAIDTLNQLLDFTSAQEDYTSLVPFQASLQGRYALPVNMAVTGMIGYYKFQETSTYFGLGAEKQFGKILTLGLTYGLIDQQRSNLGANLRLGVGPVKLTASTGNIFAFGGKDVGYTSSFIGLMLAW